MKRIKQSQKTSDTSAFHVNSRSIFTYSILIHAILLNPLLSTCNGLTVHSKAQRRAVTLRQRNNGPFTLPALSAASNDREPIAAKRQQSKFVSTRKQAKRSHSDSRLLNQKIVQCNDASSLLKVLQEASITKTAAGGVLSSVNFSTAVHRLARFSLHNQETRAQILADPRFALLLASLAEALQKQSFQSRAISNIGWALAKLRLPPPSAVVAMADKKETVEQMTLCATQIRKAVANMAMKRRNGEHGADATWTPVLSRLSGHILDHTGFMTKETCRKQRERRVLLQEYVNLLWAWATANRVDPEIFDAVVGQMMFQQQKDMGEPDAVENFRPQDWSILVWSVATAQLDSLKNYVQLLELVAKLMETFCDHFDPQGMSNTVWSVATLLSLTHKQHPSKKTDHVYRRREERAALSIIRSAASYVTKRGATTFKSQGLSNFAWAMATVGFGLSASVIEASTKNNYVVLETNDPIGDQEMMHGALLEIVKSSIPLLPKFSSQDLSNLAWGIARLVDVRFVKSQPTIQTVLDGIVYELSNEKRHISSQAISTTLWSLATLEVANESQYRALTSRLDPDKAYTYTPKELSNTLWALATAEIQIGPERDAFDTSLVAESLRPKIRDPVVLSFATAARELMRRPQQFDLQSIYNVLWSFSKIGIRHPQLFKSVAQHIIGESGDGPNVSPRGFHVFSSQGLANTAWSYARQAQLAADAGDRLKASSLLATNNAYQAVYTTSCFDIGETLLHRFFAGLAKELCIHYQRQRCKPQTLANSAWAFAVLGLKHTEFMEAIKKELMDRTSRYVRDEINGSTQFKGQSVANLLWALASLNIPAEDLIQSVTPYIRATCQGKNKEITAESIANAFTRQALANMAWACAVFGEYPPELMDILYTGLVGSTADEDPLYMAQIHGDEGLRPQGIMTMIYVQAALDLADKDQKKSLPLNFPEGWNQLSPSRNNDHTTDTFDALNLRTSKLQRAVSSAFSRIGFQHVEEYVITMEEMANNHGINVAPKPIEILSIDIANVEQKIAIEVDGPAHFIAQIDRDVVVEEEEELGYSEIVEKKLEYPSLRTGEKLEINGTTALKQRLLWSLGWKVIRIPFWEWAQLRGNEAAENEYCAKIVEQATRE